MKNKEIANLFFNMAALLEIKDENVFRIRSYYKAAENISSLAEDISVIRQEGRLGQIPGIGKTFEEKIAEYLDTGTIQAYQELIAQVPESLLTVMQVPSVGPKKAKLFFTQLGIKDLDGLEKAAKQGGLSGLPGIKEKTIENIINRIKVVRQGQERMNLGDATLAAEKIVAALSNLKEVRQIVPAGSLRRGKETVRDIDILIDATDPQKVMDAFVQLPDVKTVNAHGPTKSSILTKEGYQVDVRIVEPESFGAALLYFTGSKNFNVKLRQIAQKDEKKVSEYGIFSEKGGREKFLAGKTEKDCLHALGLPYIPPELREDMGEARLFSQEGKLQIPKLVELADIKGDLHVHSTWSDGHHSILEMAQAAQALGYEYLAISDHSQKLRVANGLSPEQLLKKKREIEQVNEKMKNFRVLFSTEVEIDSDGNLDYNDKILSDFDMVIGAVHSAFELPSDKMTARLIKACQNPHVDGIAHPTGVHLGKREPYDFDFRRVCKVAKETRTFLEINSFPIRLDLNSNNIYFAREEGVQFAINTDSHHIEHLSYMKFGISLAKRGWLTPEQVLNTYSLDAMLKRLKS